MTDSSPHVDRIISLHVWIATEQDGAEWVISADIPLFDGMRYVPLMSPSREMAQTMEPPAKEAIERLPRQVNFSLVDFVARRL